MAGRFCGHSDPDLNATVRMQLAALTHLLFAEPIGAVYCSDLRRATATAQAIAASRKIPQVLRPALREIPFGQWEGLRWEQIEQMDPDYARSGRSSIPIFPRLRGRASRPSRHRPRRGTRLLDGNRGPIAVVTHGGVLRVVLQHLCGCSDTEAWQQTQAYCCMVRYE